MKVAVMGCGGVGGYFGARLAAAGCDVAFIARGTHLDAIRTSGLRVRSPLGDVHVAPARATAEPADIGPVDIVLFATKLYDTESAGRACAPLLGPDTAVISLLNGVDSEDELAAMLGPAHVAGGVAYISAAIAEPGVIEHHGSFARMAFGERDGQRSRRLAAFLDTATAAGIDAHLSDDIEAAIWAKFVFLASFAAVTALTRLPIGPIRDVPQTLALLEDAVAEAIAVARAKGVELGADAARKSLETIDGLPGHMKSSMLVDLERGNRLELDWLSGAVCRLGADLGVATPVHRTTLAALKPYAAGTPRLP